MNNYDETDDPLFTFDSIMGSVLDFLAAVGVFCALIALLFWVGYFK